MVRPKKNPQRSKTLLISTTFPAITSLFGFPVQQNLLKVVVNNCCVQIFLLPFSLESTPLRFSQPPLYQDWIIVITNGLHIAKSSGQWTVIILLDHELERGYLATKSLFLPIWTVSPKLICSYIWPHDWVLANGMWVEGSYATSKPDS